MVIIGVMYHTAVQRTVLGFIFMLIYPRELLPIAMVYSQMEQAPWVVAAIMVPAQSVKEAHK